MTHTDELLETLQWARHAFNNWPLSGQAERLVQMNEISEIVNHFVDVGKMIEAAAKDLDSNAQEWKEAMSRYYGNSDEQYRVLLYSMQAYQKATKMLDDIGTYMDKKIGGEQK